MEELKLTELQRAIRAYFDVFDEGLEGGFLPPP